MNYDEKLMMIVLVIWLFQDVLIMIRASELANTKKDVLKHILCALFPFSWVVALVVVAAKYWTELPDDKPDDNGR